MANFVIVVDPDAKRRSFFIQKIKPIVPPVDGLITSICSSGDFCAIWAAGAWTPVSYVADDKSAAVIWGEAINGPEYKRINAKEVQRLWNNPANTLPPALDGFHAAVIYSPNRGLVVGADLLGIFPVYYYTAEDVILVGSSPELFRHHPSFRMKFNPAGLVGILLTNGLFEGQTLLRGVKRLGAGHLLIWRSKAPPQEVRQYEIPISTKYFDLSFSAHLDILDQALDKAITRHVPPGKRHGLLLSGGLDSRMLGGYLNKKGIDVVALTDGLCTDFEMRYAVAVASTLDFEHRLVNIGFDQYPLYANLKAEWEHLANGFNVIRGWGIYPHLRKLARRVVVGHLSDAIIGGSHISWAYSTVDNTTSYEAFFTRVNRWGFQPSVLKMLLKTEIFDDLVLETLARIKGVYENYSKLEFQRAWCFDLYHRQRFHVGGAVWVLSFGAWPVLPVSDRYVLEVTGGMPVTTLANRRAQTELFCRRFPELAKVSLERCSYDTTPLRPTLRQRILQHLLREIYGDGWMWKLSGHAYRFRNAGARLFKQIENARARLEGERRYYYRIYDFNGPGWQTVRLQSESYRKRVLHLFNKDMLDGVLPTPDITVKFRNNIVDASALKCLLGFLLWSKNHLQ